MKYRATLLTALILIIFVWSSNPVTAKESTINKKTKQIYVATNGSDLNSGSKETPLATVSHALEQINNNNDYEKFIIWLKDGRYEIQESLELIQSKHCTNKPITIKACNSKKAIIAGGKLLPASGWEKLQKGDVYKIVDSDARKHIKQFDLKAFGVTNYGTLKGRGFSQNVLPMEMELYVNNLRMQLARWPNYNKDEPYEGKAKYGGVVEVGSKPRFGETENNSAKFVFENKRIKNWLLNSDVWLHGVWAWDWADRRMRLLDVNSEKNELTVDCTFYGMSPNKYFYVVNAIAELDIPGEYYIDRTDGILYYWPIEPIERSEISVSMIESPLLILENVSNVTVDGIVFQEARSVGVNIVGGENNVVDNCIIRGIGSAAVNIGEGQQGRKIIGIGYGGGNTGLYEKTGWNRNGGKNNGVRNSEIYDIAAYGILLGGGDRKTLSVAGNYVENCSIHHVARVYEQMFSNIHIDGVGNRVSNCDLSFNPHSAIMFWGNDHMIQYNEIHECVYNSSDAGAIYTGRDPSQTGTTIRWNLFYDIKGHHDYEGIFFDDGASGMTVHGNIFYNIQSRGATKYHGGQNNTFTNNIVVDCITPVGYQLWNQSKWNDFLRSELIEERFYSQVNILEEPFLSAYPWLSRVFDVPYAKNSHVEERNYITSLNDPLFESGADMDFRINDWKSFRDKVPGMQIIPVERIGRKDKKRRLVSPVFVMKTERLFPNHPFEIAPSKLLEGTEQYEIYYTTDGTEPTRASLKYSKPLSLDRKCTIMARIYEIGESDEWASNVNTLQCEEATGILFLDELYPTKIHAHNGLKMNHNYAFSNRVFLDGKPYMHSIMACPKGDTKHSELIYDISFIRGDIEFSTDFGIDAASSVGSCEFIVKASKDGKTQQLYKSECLKKGSASRSISLNISGYDELILIATDGGNGTGGDHAAWGNAKLKITQNNLIDSK